MVSSKVNNTIWATDGILTGTTTPGQSKTKSNDNYGIFYIPPKFQDLSLNIRWFSVISKTLVGRGVLLFQPTGL